MKTKGFTLFELLLAMSLMGIVLTTASRLYMHVQSRFLWYETQVLVQEQLMIAQRCFQQDLARSTQIMSLNDSSMCLQQVVYQAPICYLQRDSLLLRYREEKVDSLAAFPMYKLHWQAKFLLGGRAVGSNQSINKLIPCP